MLEITEHGPIRELRLARPPVNALNGDLLRALRLAVPAAAAEGSRGIVLAGGEGLFSAGLDLPELLRLDRAGMGAFREDFLGACAAIALSPIPVVAAIGGHSPAGGTVLALLCDHRVMAAGEGRIGLNETRVGIFVPDCIQLALRRLVGHRRAVQMLIMGSMLEADRALEVGLVDELVPAAEVRARAHAWLADLLALPRRAMRATRAVARADLHAAFRDPEALPEAAFLEHWFHPETQAVLAEVVALIKSGKARPAS